MKKKKIVKTIAIVTFAALIIGGGIGLYLYNMPHRDVQATDVDFTTTSTELVKEYLENPTVANNKYLADDGESKVLEITGIVNSISEDYIGQKVILLKDSSQEAGVSATFTPETSKHVKDVTLNQVITIKGVIRAGASYDEDLELYEHVILEKSDIIK